VEAQTNPTIAFLAAGAEGLKVRITAKAEDRDRALELITGEEKELRSLLGDFVFGVDDESMESVVAGLLTERKLKVGVAESLTGGLVGARLAEGEGSSNWFRGSIVSYQKEVKFDLLDVPEGPVVSPEAASAMAVGARRLLEADVGLGVTGVAGPSTQDDQPVGTVFAAVDLDGDTSVKHVRLSGDRGTIRQLSVITVLDLLRRRLLGLDVS
jgi:nicotinamide-nucleotide amidase